MKLFTLLTTALLSISTHSHAQTENYFGHVMSDDLANHSTLQILSAASIDVLQDGGESYLGLRVFPFQPKLNIGIRAEISLDPPFEAEATVTYSWRFRLPEDFQSDAPKNRWWVMAQWHDQPDATIGETWDTKPDTSPAIALSYGELDGVDYFGMSYGAPEQSNIALIPLSRGVWHDMRMVINWSLGPDGSATFYLDNMDMPVAHAVGRNMYNAARNFFKLGIYRDPAIHINSQVHVDNISITAD